MLERILLEGLSAAHSFGDSQKILFSNLDLTEPEGSTPVRLALDERGPLNQRLNWCLLTLEKLHINAIWLEVRTHLHLIDLARDNRANSCESLQWLSIGILSTRRINDDPVTLTHTLYGRMLRLRFNAAAQPLPEAGARYERTLEAVGCSGLLARWSASGSVSELVETLAKGFNGPLCFRINMVSLI